MRQQYAEIYEIFPVIMVVKSTVLWSGVSICFLSFCVIFFLTILITVRAKTTTVAAAATAAATVAAVALATKGTVRMRTRTTIMLCVNNCSKVMNFEKKVHQIEIQTQREKRKAVLSGGSEVDQCYKRATSVYTYM